MSKHTKGPWFVELDTDTIRHGENDGNLNRNSFEVKIFGDEEANANARLIAAAPELLEELKIAVRRMKEAGWITELAEQAIAKAEGIKDDE